MRNFLYYFDWEILLYHTSRTKRLWFDSHRNNKITLVSNKLSIHLYFAMKSKQDQKNQKLCSEILFNSKYIIEIQNI